MAEETLGRAVLELVGNIAPLSAALAEGKRESEAMAKSTAAGFKGGIQRAAIPAAAALTGIVIGLHKATEAAEADQVAQARLEKAFENSHVEIGKFAGGIDDAVKSGAELGFQSADTKQAIGSLVVATGSGAKALRLLSTAQDIARFKGVSLTAASKMLTMTMSGSTRAAKQLGIQIPTMSDKQKQAAAVIDLVNDKLHGQADAYAETGDGIREKMGAEANLLAINLGKFLLPAMEAITSKLASFTGFLAEHATVVKIVIGVVGTLAAGILIYTGYVKLAAAAQAIWNGIMLANPIGLVILAIAALVAIAVVVVRHWGAVSAFFGRLWGGIKGAFSSAIDWIQSKMISFVNFLIGKLRWLIDKYNLVAGWLTGNIAAPGFIGKSGQPSVPGVRGAAAGFGGLGGPVGHAAGGIFTRPHLAMIAERGPEAVIPLTGGGGNSGMGNTIEVHLHGGIVGNERDVAIRVGREIEQLSARGFKFAF